MEGSHIVCPLAQRQRGHKSTNGQPVVTKTTKEKAKQKGAPPTDETISSERLLETRALSGFLYLCFYLPCLWFPRRRLLFPQQQQPSQKPRLRSFLFTFDSPHANPKSADDISARQQQQQQRINPSQRQQRNNTNNDKYRR